MRRALVGLILVKGSRFRYQFPGRVDFSFERHRRVLSAMRGLRDGIMHDLAGIVKFEFAEFVLYGLLEMPRRSAIARA